MATKGADDAEKLKRYLYAEWRKGGVGYVLLVGDVRVGQRQVSGVGLLRLVEVPDRLGGALVEPPLGAPARFDNGNDAGSRDPRQKVTAHRHGQERGDGWDPTPQGGYGAP